MTLLESVRTNDRRAALAKRLMEVMREIDALPDPEGEADPVEAARRKRGGR